MGLVQGLVLGLGLAVCRPGGLHRHGVAQVALRRRGLALWRTQA